MLLAGALRRRRGWVFGYFFWIWVLPPYSLDFKMCPPIYPHSVNFMKNFGILTIVSMIDFWVEPLSG
jgi:hypothetical protein